MEDWMAQLQQASPARRTVTATASRIPTLSPVPVSSWEGCISARPWAARWVGGCA